MSIDIRFYARKLGDQFARNPIRKGRMTRHKNSVRKNSSNHWILFDCLTNVREFYQKCLNSPTFDFLISLTAVFWRENVRYLTVLIRFLGKVLLYGSRQICPSSQHGHLGTTHIWLPWKCCHENWRKTRKIVCHCRY